MICAAPLRKLSCYSLSLMHFPSDCRVNSIDIVIISILASSVVDRGFEHKATIDHRLQGLSYKTQTVKFNQYFIEDPK